MTFLLRTISPLCESEEAISTVHALSRGFRFFEPDTVLGAHVSQFATLLQTTSLTSLMRLCKQIETYKQRRTNVRMALNGSKSENDISIDFGFHGLRPAPESASYLQREAEIIESLIGIVPRHAITERIERLRNRLPRAPQVYFLFYLSCLHHGDYLGAVDKLHQYFDHVLVQQQISNASTLLPYATLNLAAIHLRFGHVGEALELVREVTENVQRRKDDICLARTLSLLFRLSEQRCDASYQFQLLQQTLARSLSLCLFHLSSQTLLDAAKHYLLHPRENLGLASMPSIQENTSGSGFGGSLTQESNGIAIARPEAVWRLIGASLSAATQNSNFSAESTSTATAKLTSLALLATARTWSIYGNRTMADLASSLQLDVQKNHNLQSICGPMRTMPGTSSSLVTTTKMPTTDANASLCALAASNAEIGNDAETLKLLLEACENYPLSSSNPEWNRSARNILCDIAVRRGDLEAAEIQAIQLCALSPVHLDLHKHIEALYKLCLIMMHKGAFKRANVLIQSLIETCERSGLTVMAIAFLLTQSELFMRAFASSSKSSSPPLDALEPLLKCLTLAHAFKLDSVAAAASIQLARLHLWMDDNNGSKKRAKKAMALLQKKMPQILQNGSALVQASAKLECAKAVILLMKQDACEADACTNNGDSDNFESWNEALDDIEQVIEIGTQMGAKNLLIEAYYFKARLANALGLLVQRNLASKKFKSLLLSSSSSGEAQHPESNANIISAAMLYYLDSSSLRQLLSKLVQ